LAYKQQETIDKYSKNGIYTLKCPDCGKHYVGQIGRSFGVRFIEQFLSCKYETQNSIFLQHLQESHHSIGPLEGIMEVVQLVNKSNFMNVLEKLYIYKETYMNNRINDRSTSG
jgi:hypothetical protein